MHAGLLDMLQDAGDEDRLAVGQRIDVDLDGIAEIGVDQHRIVARGLDRVAEIMGQRRGVMDDLHGAAAEHVRWPHDDRVADARGDRERLVDRPAGAVGRLTQAEALEQRLKALAVLGQIDGVGRRADDRHAGGLERIGEAQRRLAAELDDDADQRAARLLDARQLDDVLDGQRLEVEPIRGVVVGRDGLGVAVDHDRLDAGVGEAEGGVDAAIVELYALADAVRAAAQDDHLAPVAGLGLAFGRRRPVALVARVHIGRARLELGGAGVDALVHGVHAVRPARRRNGGFVGARELGQAGVRETHLLEPEQTGLIVRQAARADLRLDGHEIGDLGQEPGVEVAGGAHLVDRQALAERLGDDQQPVGRRARQRDAQRPGAAARRVARHLDLVEPGQPDFERAQRLLQ